LAGSQGPEVLKNFFIQNSAYLACNRALADNMTFIHPLSKI
jgi:hypothetical protein